MPKISQLPLIGKDFAGENRKTLKQGSRVIVNAPSGRTTAVTPELFSNVMGSGFSNSGAFKGKTDEGGFVFGWGTGEGIRYTQNDVDNDTWKVFSLDEDVHNSVDNPYWSTPDVTDGANVGLFNGYALPQGVDSMFDFTSSFSEKYPDINAFAANPASAGSITSFGYWSGSIGRIKLDDLQYGDQLRCRFSFNAIPQVANTTIETALWYSNRNADLKETFSFPLTTQPIFYGQGTAGQLNLNRVEISAWVISNEDVNALALPAIKSNNPIIIQPLDMFVTILR